MRYRRLLRLLTLSIVLHGPGFAAAQGIVVKKLGASVVEPQALTIQGAFGQAINGKSFQQHALLTHAGFQYLGYYDADRRVCLARRKLPAGAWQSIRFTDYHFESNDAHNTISLGICPQDGTIHLAFDHHGDPLHYRVSRQGVATTPNVNEWSVDLFGEVQSNLEPGRTIRITYPRFWQTPDGGLQFCYRCGGSGNGDRMLVDYNARAGQWENTRQIDSRAGAFSDGFRADSNSRCSYPNGYDYGPEGNLHVTWVWREDSQGANHDLMYAYSDDGGRTWNNDLGEPIDGPPGCRTSGITVVPIDRRHGLRNTTAQAIDSQGRVHVILTHCTRETLAAVGASLGESRWGPPAAARYHHYWRHGSQDWRHVELPVVAGNRPKLYFDQHDNALLIFSDAQVSTDIPSSDGNLQIMAATPEAEWQDWRVIHTERGPFGNEMLADPVKWRQSGVLSVMVQDFPARPQEPTALQVLDFEVRRRN